MQDAQRLLHGALRETGFFRDLAVTLAFGAAPLADRSPPEEQVHDEGGRAVVVPHQVAQQHVDHVLVEAECKHATIVIKAIAGGKRLYRPDPPVALSERRSRRRPMLKRIKFTTVPVTDQDRALEFYTRKLGLKIFTDQTMGDMRWIELQVPGAETLLVPYPQANHQPVPTPAVVFTADNVQATYEALKAKGVEFTQTPKKEFWGEHAILKDSEGNLLLFGDS